MERICIVVPCYNEAQRLKLDVFREFLREQDDIDFCFVNDGSTDNTSEVLRRAVACCPERFLLVDNADNRGKAEAVRCGMSCVASLGRYDMIGFLDADLATPLEEIRLLADMMVKRPELCVTMGARLKRLGANVQRKAYRHYMGRVFATVVSLLFRMPVYDSQCGAKLFRAALVPELFKEPFSSGWLFDVEILLRLRDLYPDYENVVCEVPLCVWIEQGDSRIRLSHLLKMPGELLQIYRRYM